MPTYEYHCTKCGHNLEAFQRFSDPALTTCPDCQGSLRKVFSPVGIVFKGSGFYATDNRTKGKTAAAVPPATTTSSSEAGSSSEASTPASTPATSTGGDSGSSTTEAPAA